MKRLFVDYRIYLLILPAWLALFCVDPVLASTWGQLLLVIPALVGLALLLRKVLFHVDVSAVSDFAVSSELGAAIVVLADRIFLASVIIGAVLWLRG
jgi:hypothetical protein